jgi:predicted P-loop ATPase
MTRDFLDSDDPRPKRQRQPKLRVVNGGGSADPGWKDGLVRTGTGVVRPVLANAMLPLRDAPEWQGVLAWNDFSAAPVLLRNMPGQPKLDAPREVTDTDFSFATEWLNHAGIPVHSKTVAEAVQAIAGEHRFHPVREYLNRLEWDGDPRIDTWLIEYFGAEDCPLNRAFGARWLIGMVARIFEPGVQFDTALVMESEYQGLGKSSGLRALVSAEWFTDHLPDLHSKDAQQQLRAIWLVELGELAAVRRTADVERVKAFISQPYDDYRPSYGMMRRKFPRQCGFAGTVNPSNTGYLQDDTGNRRFWCVALGVKWKRNREADIEALAAVRDQFWAEAVHRFREGEVWWLDTPKLKDAQAKAAEARMDDDPRERQIAAFIEGRSHVHMADILGPDCLQIPIERWTRGLRTEIGFVLSSLKWRRKRVRLADKSLEWRYEKSRK